MVPPSAFDLATMAAAISPCIKHIGAVAPAADEGPREVGVLEYLPGLRRLAVHYQALIESGSSSVQHPFNGNAGGNRQSLAMRSDTGKPFCA